MFFESVVLLLMLFATLLAFIFVSLWFVSIVGSGAPFVPVPAKSVPGIVDALELKEGSVVYDMGCGDGRILLSALEKVPNIRAVGIEKAFLPYMLAKWKLRGTSAELTHGDFFKTDLRDATHVVLYLLPSLMEKIEKKLQAELRSDAVVLAIDFSFKEKVPLRVIEQTVPGLRRGKDLRIYNFS